MKASYKTALRAKGIKSVPAWNKLRSARGGDQVIDATVSAILERNSR